MAWRRWENTRTKETAMKKLAPAFPMIQKLNILLLVFSLLFIYGCSTANSPTPTANIAGNWVTSFNGTLYPENNWQLYTTTITMEISQSGTTISGTSEWSDTKGMSGDAPFTGTVSGNNVTFISPPHTTPESAVVSGNSMVLSGNSPGGTPYSWTFAKQ